MSCRRSTAVADARRPAGAAAAAAPAPVLACRLTSSRSTPSRSMASARARPDCGRRLPRRRRATTSQTSSRYVARPHLATNWTASVPSHGAAAVVLLRGHRSGCGWRSTGCQHCLTQAQLCPGWAGGGLSGGLSGVELSAAPPPRGSLSCGTLRPHEKGCQPNHSLDLCVQATFDACGKDIQVPFHVLTVVANMSSTLVTPSADWRWAAF